MTGTIKAIILFVFIPFVFYLIFAIIKKVITKESLKVVLTQLVLAILPVTASMHLLKALLKTSSRIPYWDFVFLDPNGVKTAQSIIDNPEILDKSIIVSISPYITAITLLLSVGGIVLSMLIISNQKDQIQTSKLVNVIAVFIYAGIFLTTILVWRMY